ncbi:hypothetical protein K1719_038100 [Acacia pycnantha]|nr:hypothetical protein K1719_038100 [Acacia pycnantha]
MRTWNLQLLCLYDYGHLSNAFNATLVTLNPNIAEATLLKERLSQDSGGSQLFSQISNAEYPTYSPESLLSFRTRISLSDIAKLDQEGRNSTIPKELDKIAGKVVIVKLRVILPSSFTGGARYMIQNYQDAMAICAWADVYTIEFQKRGLPHAHIILWLSNADKLKTPFDVDQLISAEIPNKELDPELYELVGSYMVHGPCGRSSRSAPCMKDGKCSKFFPKRYCQRTMLDENGYPTYRRRDDGRTVSRKGV